MFRKYYKQANEDIKPDEEFVNSVIRASRRRRPPSYRRYAKYAASAAVMAAVVSAAVISMPLWNKVDNDNGGVIETKTEYSSAGKSSDEADRSAVAAEQPSTPDASGDEHASADAQGKAADNAAQDPTAKPAVSNGTGRTAQTKRADSASAQKNSAAEDTDKPKNSVFSQSVQAPPPAPVSTASPAEEKEAVRKDVAQDTEDAVQSETDKAEDKTYTTASSAAMQKSAPISENGPDENQLLGSKLKTRAADAGSDEDTAAEEKMYSARVFSAPAQYTDDLTAAEAAAGSMYEAYETDDTYDSGYQGYDIPAPSGYYRTYASDGSCTFENGEGAVINVTITRGGGDSAPSYETDGDHIRASYASDGTRITVSAYGAQMDSVKEIINSFTQ